MGIAENMKRLRTQYNLTQDDLGKIAGVSGKAVWCWENGTAEPRMGAIQNMSNYFGIPKSVLIDEQGTPFIDRETMLYAIELRENPEMQMLFHAAQGVNKEDLMAAVDIIKRLSQNKK